MFTNQFGLEVEFTGITRQEAAKTASYYLNGMVNVSGDYYDTHKITVPDGRVWKVMYDGSLHCQKKEGRRTVPASDSYSVELVSPILLYREDIDQVQALVRRLRKAGGFANKSCGIHIHLDGASHTPRSIRNFVNIIYAHNDLLYKALQIAPERMRYCKKMDAYLVERMNQSKPKTLRQIESIWYENYSGSRNGHYHQSRYHFLNLHSFFHGNRAYIVLALALNHQALTQKSASYRKVQEENEKFAMRVWLNRIGFIGDEFKSCREHLYQHLDGNAAWRYGSRENVRSHINTRNTQNGGSQNEQ